MTVMVNGVSGISRFPGAYKCAGKFIIQLNVHLELFDQKLLFKQRSIIQGVPKKGV